MILPSLHGPSKSSVNQTWFLCMELILPLPLWIELIWASCNSVLYVMTLPVRLVWKGETTRGQFPRIPSGNSEQSSHWQPDCSLSNTAAVATTGLTSQSTAHESCPWVYSKFLGGSHPVWVIYWYLFCQLKLEHSVHSLQFYCPFQGHTSSVVKGKATLSPLFQEHTLSSVSLYHPLVHSFDAFRFLVLFLTFLGVSCKVFFNGL